MEKTKGEGKLSKWFGGLKSEFSKIIWPNREDVTRQTIAVVITSIIVGLIIALVDVAAQRGIDFLIGL